MLVDILEWDSKFFGFKVARITYEILPSYQDLSDTLLKLKDIQVRLVYCYSESKYDYLLIEKLEGLLVDKKTTFTGNTIRCFSDSMSVLDLEYLSVQSGKYSRFAVDHNIPKEKYYELYRIWINKSIRSSTNEVLVIPSDNEIVGMIVLGRGDGEYGSIDLIAVNDMLRGKNYGRQLMNAAALWFMKNKYGYVQVVTQGDNIPACNLYKSCGYSASHVNYVYHFWL